MAAYDFFYRAYNRDVQRMLSEGNVRELRIHLEGDWDLAALLDEARKQGLPTGSYQSGCFQVQGPNGIWASNVERKINPANHKSYTFKTWEELDAEIDD